MTDLTPNRTPDTSRDATRDTAADQEAVPGVNPGEHRPTSDRARAAKAAEAVRAGEAARSAKAARAGQAARPGETALPGEAAPAGGTAAPGEAVPPGERGRTSTAPRGTAAAGEPTPLGADVGAGGTARGRAAGAGRDAGPLSASQDGAQPRHRDGGAVDDATGADRAPTAATAGRQTGHGTPLLPGDECDLIASRMRHAVVGFVDGPRDAVAEADQVLEELAARFTDAVDRRRRTLRGSWQGAEGGKDRSATAGTATDTEQLRLALRDYRELTERLLHL
ncbi:hypothetical protein [Streptomyces rishiriensis]|uniref:Uncharacterized protein n=1 Tax=Streptomyces rishiriensis TaxID=68264 RepID=A0ABU0NPR8_STRRH|nr:hypothetical protein [Streptomyces rishiriensis]MDQ0580718.1 hypothetical protein [Streptomyces rishiriensis]